MHMNPLLLYLLHKSLKIELSPSLCISIPPFLCPGKSKAIETFWFCVGFYNLLNPLYEEAFWKQREAAWRAGFQQKYLESFAGRAVPWENRMRNNRLGSKSNREIGRGSVSGHDGEGLNQVEPGYHWQIHFQG